jgi:hypothetical protein
MKNMDYVRNAISLILGMARIYTVDVSFVKLDAFNKISANELVTMQMLMNLFKNTNLKQLISMKF